jgi:hypothetical protein
MRPSGSWNSTVSTTKRGEPLTVVCLRMESRYPNFSSELVKVFTALRSRSQVRTAAMVCETSAP